MLKQRLLKLVIALALMVAATGASSVVADSLGFSTASPAFACEDAGTSGGGC
jgi:hypothetical protein